MNAVAQKVAQSGIAAPLARPYCDFTAQQLLTHLRERIGVHYFPVPDAEETRAEKIEALMQNRFDFNGETHRLPEAIDWLSNPSADVEWHILMHKFYYAAGLGIAYRASADARYAVKWMSLTESWIAQTPVGFIAADVTGRRVQNWIYAFYYFVSLSPAAPICPAFIQRFLASLGEQVNFLCDNLTPARNHRTLELYAIFLASIVFPEFADAQRWRELSVAELARNIESDLLPDGVHCELSTDYHHLVVKNFLNVRRLARMNQIEIAPVFDRRLIQALEFSMHAHKPDGIVPSLSDGDARGFLDLLAQGAELYGRADMRYVATGGAQGVAPRRRARGFDAAGYYVLRSGWGRGQRAFGDEQYLIFDCGPLGAGNHGHLDCLSFELAAFGRSLVVDPGRYTYSEAGETNWRIAFRGTAYHNTVTVDGRNQTRYEPRVVKDASRHKHGTTRHRIAGPAPEARALAFESRHGLDFVHGEARSHEYDVVHQRRIAFVFDEYWLVCDTLRASKPHDYDLRFHLAPQAQGNAQLRRARATLELNSPNLLIAHEDVGELQAEIETGYVSYKYGEKHESPVLRLHQRGSNARFHSVLYPYAQQPPSLHVRELCQSQSFGYADEEAGVLRIALSHEAGSYTDFIFYSQTATGLTRCGGYEFRGRFVAMRKDSYGEIVAVRGSDDALLSEGRQLIYRGTLA